MPRPLVKSGIRGPGQTRFPEEAKETGRDLGLTGTVQVLENNGGLDAGGAPKRNPWTAKGSPVRGRIDPVGQAKDSTTSADQISEETTHIVSVDPGLDVKADNRLNVNGSVYGITGIPDQTDPLILRIEVKGFVS